MEFRWCPGCHVLIDARLVFCTEQCSNAYFADSEKEPTPYETKLSDAIVTRLKFMRWVRAQGELTIFDEGVINADVVARFLTYW